MSDSVQSEAERIVGGFASLMSSALTLEGDGGGMEPLKDSSETLPRFISPTVMDEVCCMLPTLLLKHGETSSGGSIEDVAALNLARPMSLSRDVLEAAPMALLGNLCESLSLLIDSRLRSSTAALVRQSQRQADPTLTRVLVGLLACSQSPISPTTVVTSFSVMPSSEVTASGDLVMPLVAEAIVDTKIFGTLNTLKLVAPGNIQATLGPDFMITKAEIVLDTVTFLQSMMKQARYAVRKAVATASKMATALLMPSSMPDAAVPNKVESSHDLTGGGRLKRSISKATTNECPSNSSLMPPPPSRPSRISLADMTMTKSTSSDDQVPGGGQNASWGVEKQDSHNKSSVIHPGRSLETRQILGEGLSLLTAAAGMERGLSSHKRKSNEDNNEHQRPNGKRQKTNVASFEGKVPTPRRVTSCPRLEAAV
mmetsp:Transcript_32463/g.74598  ORF Transcript_32463/g.74598 Transcript_32463/m.74598 type:complete len:426 (+) Transcript_32463:192-1469(+)|eukprot:CAMPEP_0116826326 /NCGR_PEP_ID=MMETSP0418-20121206/2470_1 /TAXON_ID=1158023 /ORGANISM="Astrosyne radiata, Strain 13vi08-1A" /LENGTH=425 /DNA_ID=CAMNT_0004454955 /DNA_START=124 /DNA_END=1401 /DNA_ORIENTATION=+